MIQVRLQSLARSDNEIRKNLAVTADLGGLPGRLCRQVDPNGNKAATSEQK
jgi:hypothetical protein